MIEKVSVVKFSDNFGELVDMVQLILCIPVEIQDLTLLTRLMLSFSLHTNSKQPIITPSIITIPLLMPKVIQPRRHDKSLDVQEFWNIRDQAKTQVNTSKPIPAYKEEQVLLRHRYQRPSQKAKTFNPLALMLRRQRKAETNELYQIGAQDQLTCVAEFLNGVQLKVTAGIGEIKKLVMGRKSIIHNATKIFRLLLSHLEYQDTWPLLQAVLRDIRGEDIQFWMVEGLQVLAEGILKTVGSGFNEIVFRNLFDTLCVFMQNFYERIITNINRFFAVYAQVFFACSNKYLRTFSVQTFSYLLTNMNSSQYNEFMHFLLQNQHFFEGEVSLADLLIQRLRVVRGCLSAASLTHFFDQIQTLSEILNIEGEQSNLIFKTLTSDYIFAVLSGLNNRQGSNDDQILFDFNHVLTALIQFNTKHAETYQTVLVMAFSKFISLFKSDKKRFQPYNKQHSRYLLQMWNNFANFYKQNVNYYIQSDQLFFSIAILMVKSNSSLYYDNQIIKCCKQNSQAVSTIIKVVYQNEDPIESSLLDVILLLSKQLLKDYLLGSQVGQLIYMLIIIIKRNHLTKFIQCTWLQVTASQILTRITTSNVDFDLIILLRLITFLKFAVNSEFIQTLKQLKRTTLSQYQTYMTENLKHQRKELTPEQLYDEHAFTKEIILYSHHEIGWLSHVFNLFEAFSQSFQHIQKISGIQCKIQASACWNQLIISRSSAVSILKQSGYLTANQNYRFLLNFLASRNREVRFHALQVVISQLPKQSKQIEIIQKLSLIDENLINLDNQRQVKRIFCLLQSQLDYFNQTQPLTFTMLEYLIQWSIGFAFTGFKLIQNSFINFFTRLIDLPLTSNSKTTIVQNCIMPFLEYYHYRHSRQYETDLSSYSKNKHLTNAFQIKTNQQIVKFVKEDFQLCDVQTVEWIGLQRIAQAIKVSKKGKTNLGYRLKQLVQTYFKVQFLRVKNTIQSHSTIIEQQGQQNHSIPPSYLLPIKQRFLIVILKLCPTSIVPPFACLHHNRDQYFEVSGVKKIKRNEWQAMWQKKTNNISKKKIQISEKASSTINLEHLGPQQQQMYLHYLWKQIIEANRHKKRIILDHIRNYLPTASNRLIAIFFQSVFLEDLQLTTQNGETMNEVVKRLRLMNRRQLLNSMFILKAIVMHMKLQVNESDTLKKILVFIVAIMQIVYDYSNVQSVENNDDKQPQEEEQDQLNEQQGEDEAKYGTKQKSFEYKLHRKQLQKLLQILFANHQLSNQILLQLLQFLLQNTKINLPKSSRLSVPGLLLILNIISQTKQYCLILCQVKQGRIITMLTDMMRADEAGSRPLKACFNLWLSIISNTTLSSENSMVDEQIQNSIDTEMKKHSQNMLSSMLSYTNADQSKHEIKVRDGFYRSQQKESPQILKWLRIANKMMELAEKQLEEGWEQYLWAQLLKVSKLKKVISGFNYEKLNLLISILSKYIKLKGEGLGQQTTAFLRKIIRLLPSIKDPEQRLTITKLIATNHKQLGLREKIVELAAKTGELKKTGLVTTLDFNSFFDSCNQYTTNLASFQLIEHEYYLHNMLCYVDHDQLSVRRAVSNCNRQFLLHYRNELKAQLQEQNINKLQVLQLVLKIYRVLLDLLHKVNIQMNEAVFWSIVDSLGIYVDWISSCAVQIQLISHNHNAKYYNVINESSNSEQNLFKLLAALSESNKLKALKSLKVTLQSLVQKGSDDLILWESESQLDIPNPISKAILPIIEYLIIRPTENNHVGPKSNLGSSFAIVCLDLLPVLASLLKQSTIKKELKRLVSKLKFTDAQSKKNIAVIKMIGQIIEGVPGDRANQKLKEYLEQHGFEEFHKKIAEHSRTPIQTQQEQSDSQPQPFGKRQRIPDFYDKLQQLQSDEAINRNFMKFDKKLMEVEQEDADLDQSQLSFFLKKQVLLPLRTMLMMQSRSKEEQQQSKSKVLLSVTVTKVLLRLPMDLFLREFQKVISRLARLLKKRQVQVRENARGCLCEIAKSVGSQLLYAIIMELRFNLKDNFDRHVFNYSICRLLEVMPLSSGDLDYCIPLILPMIVDEIYGQSSQEKELVQRGEVPTLKMEAKKKKGLELLQMLCRYISHNKLSYLINFLQKYLREHLITQENLGKYDQMLGAISAGLSANSVLLNPENTPALLPALAEPISTLREQIKMLNWQQKPIHENTVRNSWSKRKAGKEKILGLQAEAGRNGSIFKHMTKEAGMKRNNEIMASSLIQFYLVLLSLLIRKQTFTLQSSTQTLPLAQQLLTLLAFLNECVDHRDNRLVSKSLKILHLALSWRSQDLGEDKKEIATKLKSLKKQVSRKILLLIEQLTLSDQQLLKQCFVFFNDLISEAAMNIEMIPNIVSVIKLHTPTSQDQTHLSQPYKLFRTILLKGPLLYNQFITDIHKMVRMQIVTCHNKEIRQISKNILSVYLRPRASLQPSIEAFNLSQKKQGNQKQLTYQNAMNEQLTFYLSNLDSTGQSAILELLQQFVQSREKGQMQTYGQLMLLSLMTAKTNQLSEQSQLFAESESENANPIDSLVISILKKLDQNKILGLINKCMSWMNSERLSSIRLCGSSFLRIITDQNLIKLSKYVSGKEALLSLINTILVQEAKQFESNAALSGRKNLESKQWNQILNNMQIESPSYDSDKSVIEILHLFINISQNQQLMGSADQQVISSIICSIWKLLHQKNSKLSDLLIRALQNHKVLPILSGYSEGEEKLYSNQKDKFSLKKVIASLIFNSVQLQAIESLLRQILGEEHLMQNGTQNLRTVGWLFVGLALKGHIKPNIYQNFLPTIVSLLNNIVLARDINGYDCLSASFDQPNFKEKLMELTLKLASNDLIPYEIKSLVQHSAQILKERLGVNEYFKAVGEYETRKRDKKESQKIRLSEMAILNPQQFGGEKRNKKRKID